MAWPLKWSLFCCTSFPWLFHWHFAILSSIDFFMIYNYSYETLYSKYCICPLETIAHNLELVKQIQGKDWKIFTRKWDFLLAGTLCSTPYQRVLSWSGQNHLFWRACRWPPGHSWQPNPGVWNAYSEGTPFPVETEKVILLKLFCLFERNSVSQSLCVVRMYVDVWGILCKSERQTVVVSCGWHARVSSQDNLSDFHGADTPSPDSYCQALRGSGKTRAIIYMLIYNNVNI